MPDLTGCLNYRYYTERLADPTLLDTALVTDSGDLAVPVGGTRRGGFTNVISIAEGTRLLARMRELPGQFPHPRFAYSWQAVEFGPEPPDDDEEAGRFYGYSEAAIRTFMLRMQQLERKRS